MTYNLKEKTLHTGVREKFKLNQNEHFLLICLSSGDIATYNEMSEYLYLSEKRLHALRLRLIEKTKNNLKIKIVRGIGFILENEIYFK